MSVFASWSPHTVDWDFVDAKCNLWASLYALVPIKFYCQFSFIGKIIISVSLTDTLKQAARKLSATKVFNLRLILLLEAYYMLGCVLKKRHIYMCAW